MFSPDPRGRGTGGHPPDPWKTCPRSDQFGRTWSAQRWLQEHWKPINSLGYRDVEHSFPELKRKNIVVVLGDSCAAGDGIKRTEDRFADRLQKKLGDAWVVRNVAENGWGTQEQNAALASLKPRPDVIILLYRINDILSAAFKHGFNDPFRIERPKRYIIPFICLQEYESYAEKRKASP